MFLKLKCAFVLQIVFRTHDTSNFGALAVCTSALSDWLGKPFGTIFQNNQQQHRENRFRER